jgi:hypothetical protein
MELKFNELIEQHSNEKVTIQNEHETKIQSIYIEFNQKIDQLNEVNIWFISFFNRNIY